MPRPPRPAPILPTDDEGYFHLLSRCIQAPDKAALVALVAECVAFEGGRFVQDFKHEWWNRWLHLGISLDELPQWPRTPLSYASPSEPDATT
jgi:hypothetical protein